MIRIDATRALDLLDAAVRAKGEYTTASGMYVKQGEPNCMAGVALHLGGVTIEQLKFIELIPFDQAVGEGYTRDFLDITDEAVKIFHTAQMSNDNGETWSVARWRARQEWLRK
jgi:hypothetical protein